MGRNYDRGTRLNLTYACIKIHGSDGCAPAPAHNFFYVWIAGPNEPPCYR